jgi:hypothetical protein
MCLCEMQTKQWQLLVIRIQSDLLVAFLLARCLHGISQQPQSFQQQTPDGGVMQRSLTDRVCRLH